MSGLNDSVFEPYDSLGLNDLYDLLYLFDLLDLPNLL